MLVNCAAYEDGHKLADIAVPDIRTYTSRPNSFVWVAVSDPEPAELDELQREFDLHPLAVEDARKGHQRPKIEEYGASLFAALHVVEIEGDTMQTGEVAIFVGPSYVLSVRRGTRRGFADVRQRTEQEPELLRHGPGYVLYALMDTVVDRYFPAIEAFEDEIVAIEDRIFAGETTRATIEALYELKRKLTVLTHATEPLLEATGKLQAGRVPRLCSGLTEYFRDVYDHLGRLSQSIANLREMVATATAVNLSLITLQEGEVTKQLAAYAALAAVPTMIGGLYGMNFQYMPELGWRYGYPIVVGAMVAIDGYLFYRFRKAKWI
jgi:magnesium transporter